VKYVNVISESGKLESMLKHSKGKREVPVIVEGDRVTIGFDGGS
jgi:glutaredoxin